MNDLLSAHVQLPITLISVNNISYELRNAGVFCFATITTDDALIALPGGHITLYQGNTDSL